MYAAHEKVYPREVSGRFATLRWVAVLVLLGLFYGMSWVQWDGRQAVLFDLPARKFYIFGWTFFPQDFYLLTWLLIMAALSLFFFTASRGGSGAATPVRRPYGQRLRLDGAVHGGQPLPSR